MEAWVIRDPEVMLGKPVVAGTRITVEEILRRLAAGETPEEVLAAHPRLTPEGLRAALLYAAETLGAEVYYPVPDLTAIPHRAPGSAGRRGG